MSDNLTLLEKQVADLRSDLATAREENKAMKQNIEEAKDKEFAATVEALKRTAQNKLRQSLDSKKPLRPTWLPLLSSKTTWHLRQKSLIKLLSL